MVAMLVIIVMLVPFVPWRATTFDANLGPKWSSVKRYVGLFGPTDSYGVRVSWAAVRRETCDVMQKVGGTDMMASLTGVVGALTASKNPGVNVWAAAGLMGGNIAMCKSWLMCKNGVIQRCNYYNTWMVISLGIMGLLAICVPLCALNWGLCASEYNIEKKKLKKSKKETLLDNKRLVIFMNISFVWSAVTFGSLAWVCLSKAMETQFQKTSYWPQHLLSAGPALALFASFLLFPPMIISFVKAFIKKDEDAEKKEKEDEEGEDGGDGGYDGGKGQGYDGGYGGKGGGFDGKGGGFDGGYGGKGGGFDGGYGGKGGGFDGGFGGKGGGFDGGFGGKGGGFGGGMPPIPPR